MANAEEKVIRETLIRALLIIQDNKCAICYKKFIHKRDRQLDHCHNSNVIRGLLCRRCNSGLGMFEDDIEYLRNAISYILYHRNNIDANLIMAKFEVKQKLKDLKIRYIKRLAKSS